MSSSFEATCKTYTKVMEMIEHEYEIPIPDRNGKALIDCVKQQFAAAVREECRRAAEEGACRAYRLADEAVAASNPNGLYVPAADVQINNGGVGRMKLRAFRGWPSDRRSVS